MANVEEAIRFLSTWFRGVEGDVYLCSLPNERGGKPGLRFILTRDPGEVEAFIAKWDKPGRGIFFCVSTLRPGAKPGQRGDLRSKENAWRLPGAFADCDFKMLEGLGANPMAEVTRRLEALELAPAIVNASGGGLHAFWPYEKAIDLEEPGVREAAEEQLRSLAEIVGGDPAVCEVARLMRLPGTTNSKKDYPQARPVLILKLSAGRFLGDGFAAWRARAKPVLPRATPARSGSGAEKLNPFERHAQAFKGPVDVEARLAAMRYQGLGESGIHTTQVSVTAALLERGEDLEAVVERVLEATLAVAPAGWSAKEERRALVSMCETWLEKMRKREGEVVDLAARREERAGGSKKKQATADRMALSAAGRKKAQKLAWQLVEAKRAEGGDYLLLPGAEIWECGQAGTDLGALWQEADETTIMVALQDLLGGEASPSRKKDGFNLFRHLPPLFRREQVFDGHGCVPVLNGLLDVAVYPPLLRPYRPDDFATYKMAVRYEVEPQVGFHASAFAQWLERLLGALEEEERAQVTDSLQEVIGTFLLNRQMPRELLKMLLIVGPSRTGKTEFASLFRLLFEGPGARLASPSITSLGEPFGLQPLLGCVGIVRDDALKQGERLHEANMKVLTTKERVDVARKRESSVRGHVFHTFIVLTMNELPKVKEATEAITNRSIVVNLENIFPEESAVGHEPLRAIVEREGPTILQWALSGLYRARERGYFALPPLMRTWLQDYREDSNLVAQFVRTCLEYDGESDIPKPELSDAWKGFQAAQDVSRPSSYRLRERLKKTEPRMREVKIEGERYYRGFCFTSEGRDCLLKGANVS